MHKRSSKVRRHSVAFRKLQRVYNLKTPEQIKMAILWHHVKALMVSIYPQNAHLLKKYDGHWSVCELEEHHMR